MSVDMFMAFPRHGDAVNAGHRRSDAGSVLQDRAPGWSPAVEIRSFSLGVENTTHWARQVAGMGAGKIELRRRSSRSRWTRCPRRCT